MWSDEELGERLDATVAAWRSWSDTAPGLRRAVAGPGPHSGRVLQALSYQPSGAIVAAATTSLPEEVGGERNWDYRYSWVRDASLTMEALWVAACPDEASDFFAFMAAAAPSMRPGEGAADHVRCRRRARPDRADLAHLRGWRDSRPVRVGNGAWNQQQIDVYGELLDAAHRLAASTSTSSTRTTRALPGTPAPTPPPTAGGEPDQGIWEVRGEPRHFLYSKVMCWVALDRAVALADR